MVLPPQDLDRRLLLSQTLPSVRLEPSGWHFEATPGRTLLDAASAAGIELPRSCRNGTCRACRCLLRSGSVVYRIEWPGLLAEEKREGWILPCVAHAQTDLVVEAPLARRTGETPTGTPACG